MANVKRLNYELGKIFNGYMNKKEIETGQDYREWTDILNFVRKELNKERKILPDKDPYNYPFPDVETNAKYKVGDIVYYRSDVPLSALGYKQPTERFRVGDYHFNIYDPRKVTKILYYPKNCRYLLDGKMNVSYAESELKPAKTPKYVIKQILDKKVEKNKIYYLIWWKFYPKNRATWETKSNLIKNGLNQLIKGFENSSNKKRKIKVLSKAELS
jgi:hypothetical protein